MFQIGEIKKWAKTYGITVKKQDDGYIWFKDKETPTNPEPLADVVRSVFNEVTDNKFIQHQSSYKPEPT
jgi:hypothetical protein